MSGQTTITQKYQHNPDSMPYYTRREAYVLVDPLNEEYANNLNNMSGVTRLRRPDYHKPKMTPPDKTRAIGISLDVDSCVDTHGENTIYNEAKLTSAGRVTRGQLMTATDRIANLKNIEHIVGFRPKLERNGVQSANEMESLIPELTSNKIRAAYSIINTAKHIQRFMIDNPDILMDKTDRTLDVATAMIHLAYSGLNSSEQAELRDCLLQGQINEAKTGDSTPKSLAAIERNRMLDEDKTDHAHKNANILSRPGDIPLDPYATRANMPLYGREIDAIITSSLPTDSSFLLKQELIALPNATQFHRVLHLNSIIQRAMGVTKENAIKMPTSTGVPMTTEQARAGVREIWTKKWLTRGTRLKFRHPLGAYKIPNCIVSQTDPIVLELDQQTNRLRISPDKVQTQIVFADECDQRAFEIFCQTRASTCRSTKFTMSMDEANLKLFRLIREKINAIIKKHDIHPLQIYVDISDISQPVGVDSRSHPDYKPELGDSFVNNQRNYELMTFGRLISKIRASQGSLDNAYTTTLSDLRSLLAVTEPAESGIEPVNNSSMNFGIIHSIRKMHRPPIRRADNPLLATQELLGSDKWMEWKYPANSLVNSQLDDATFFVSSMDKSIEDLRSDLCQLVDYKIISESILQKLLVSQTYNLPPRGERLTHSQMNRKAEINETLNFMQHLDGINIRRIMSLIRVIENKHELHNIRMSHQMSEKIAEAKNLIKDHLNK